MIVFIEVRIISFALNFFSEIIPRQRGDNASIIKAE